jgi:hypothetical protein
MAGISPIRSRRKRCAFETAIRTAANQHISDGLGA